MAGAADAADRGDRAGGAAGAGLAAHRGPPRRHGASSAGAGALGSRLAFWRGLAGFASIAALGLAVLLASPPAVQPPILVVLASTARRAGGAAPASIVASISGDGRALVTRPLVPVARAARPLARAVGGAEAPGGAALARPHPGGSGATVALRGQVLADADTLAVSVEPPGGSPTGAPTGPILYAGKFSL